MGDRERAAEISLSLTEAAWYTGDRDATVEELDQARSLIAGMPPSPVQADVLVEVSRYDMLADRNEKAIEVGREASTKAEELGLDLVRAKALNNIGSSRVHLEIRVVFTTSSRAWRSRSGSRTSRS